MQLSRLHKIIILISLCLLAQLSISWKTWLPINREFPLISAFAIFPVHYSVFMDGLFLGLLVVSLAALIFKPFSKPLIIFISFIFVLFVLEDITRFQPWLYMYLLVLLSIAITNEQNALFVIRIILVGTYFWSGLQKFNHAFTVEIFPWLMRPFGLQSFFENHHRLVYGVSLIEIVGSIGLLSRKYQKYGGLLLIIMHIILLYALGPLGNSWNKLIWPWNAALIGILVLLTTDKNYSGLFEFTDLIKSAWFIIVFGLTCIMPAFNFFGYWDYYLSDSLYSGNNPEAIFYYVKADRNNMPVSARHSQFYYPGSGGEFLMIDQWALDDLNTPIYPQERCFKRISKYLSSKVVQPDSAGLIINEKDKITSKQHEVNIPCNNLLKL